MQLGAFEGVIRRFRIVAFAGLSALRAAPAGQSAARFVRTRLPGAYAAVIRRYEAYGQLAVAPKRRPAGVRFRAPELDGLAPEEALVAQRVAIAQHLAARRP
jgi:hypothetical protein